MRYLKRHRHATRRRSRRRSGLGPDPEQRGRLRLGGRRLGAAAPLPVLGSEGGSYYARRVEAHARERRRGRALPRGRRPARGRRDRRDQRRGPRAEERPGACSRSRWRPAPRDEATRKRGARGAAARVPHGHAPVPVRDVRRGLPRLGPLAAARGRRLVRRPLGRRRSPTRRSSTAQREGVTHRDLLRLAHPAGRVSAGNPTLERDRRARAACSSGSPAAARPTACRGSSRASRSSQAAETPARAAELVREYGLPREALQSEHLDVARGLGGAARGHADDGARPQPRDDDPRRRARAGLGRHGEGGRAARRPRADPQGARSPDRAPGGAAHVRGGSRRARPAQLDAGRAQIVDALDAAFYTAFENVEPTGKRLLLALDVSGSMARRRVAGVPGLTPRDASAALALVTAATETRYEIGRLLRRQAAASEAAAGGRWYRGTRRPDAARDQPAAAAGRRRADVSATCRSAARTARCRCCTRSTASVRSTRS